MKQKETNSKKKKREELFNLNQFFFFVKLNVWVPNEKKIDENKKIYSL